MSRKDIVEIRLVCKTDYLDPKLKDKLYEIRNKLRQILHIGRRRFALKKIQPWNSIKVTFDIPKEAADRLRLLAIEGNVRLIELDEKLSSTSSFNLTHTRNFSLNTKRNKCDSK
ncbi:unnamed protein product [Rotaria sp. Silwood1]|nr:unnamed protein product [Rotaria sp. Silwood1]CAF0848471.1 unnamed protein product [Rotaria sp. Silwood1]CAF0959495.1 unnamed protein product [Rotaria sp. Silwood1]CAF3374882.1 unnamed protein product [Rotaria sp. Silwood1]CAF3379961.1 unnamed protein product [Rotaria sp. Silwood1]